MLGFITALPRMSLTPNKQMTMGAEDRKICQVLVKENSQKKSWLEYSGRRGGAKCF